VLDDRRFELRLNRPFGLLLDAFGKATSFPCFIYPERLAAVDPAQPFSEVVGSGPYRFVPEERVSGSHYAPARPRVRTGPARAGVMIYSRGSSPERTGHTAVRLA
jgi:hypothetical protein